MSSSRRPLRPGEKPGMEGLPATFGRALQVAAAVILAALIFAAILAIVYLIAGLIGEWRS